MSNIVIWKTATEIIEILKSENALVSGMSVAEAAYALGYVKSAGGVYIKTVIATSAESVAGATASAVAESATVTATTTATNLALYETSSGTAAVAGVGSVAAPIAATMAAAAGGYLIGAEIYKHNSTFLDKLMYPIYDFITGNNVTATLYDEKNAPSVPILFDVNGNTFLPSEMVNGITNFLKTTARHGTSDASRILEAETFLKNNPVYKYYVLLYKVQGYYEVMYSSTPICIQSHGSSASPTIMEFRAQPDILSCRYTNYPSYPTMSNQLFGTPTNMLYDPTGAVYDFYGNIVSTGGSTIYNGDTPYYTPPIELPSGVTKYTPGTSPTPLIIPDAPTWTPAELPASSPLEMPDPVRNPDPTKTPERITPYIPPIQPQPKDVPIKKPVTNPVKPVLPVINPEPDASTNPYPPSDPTRDPSQPLNPDGSINPAPTPVPIPKPSNSGSVPVPVVPIIPTFSAANGLLHVYNPTSEQIDQFGTWLWTTFSGDLIDTLSKLFNNPMDAVIGLHELYCTPTTGESTTIKAGYLDSGVTSRLVTSRYKEVKCGAISVPEFWGNYLDYSPYTKTYCYLPFIGIVELNADDVVGHGVEITYRVDTYNGSCIALITTAKAGSQEAMTYQYSGNCSVELPITSGMKSAIQGALIGAATLAVGAATGGSGLVAASALGAIRGGASSKNTVQHSGSFGSSYGAMGIKKPYIIVKRPVQKVVAGYNENYGYPAHKKVLISGCTGYLKVIEVDVISSTATEDEKKMIETQLKNGIFVS